MPLSSPCRIMLLANTCSIILQQTEVSETEYSCGKRNPLYPIRAASFVSTVLYLILTPQVLY
jgi:hypothetical protein